MPNGYLVTIVDTTVDVGDSIGGAWTFFNIDEALGAGQWVWSGTFNGTNYTNEVEPGQYYLATDGNVYFVPDFGQVTTITSASVNAEPPNNDITETTEGGSNGDTFSGDAADNFINGRGGDDTIDGGGGNDTLSGGSGGDNVSGGTGDDTIYGGSGNDTLNGNDGEDTIHGGEGNDTINGNADNDTIYGDNDVVGVASSEALNWSAEGPNGTDLSNFVQTSGDIDISVDFALGFADVVDVSTSQQYVGAGEPMSTTSALQLGGAGTGENSTTTISFEAVPGSGVSSQVEDVVFRLNDIDSETGTWIDHVTVTAFDVDGNPVTVTLTASGNDTVSGNEAYANPGAGNDSANEAAGSVLVEISGPVHSIEILYENDGNSNQFLWVTDVHFDTIPMVEGDDNIDGGAGDDNIFGNGGDDTIIGGTGADTIDGGTGDDTITFAEGDTVVGGDGDDLFILADYGEATNGTITITGGEGGETNGDELRLGTLADLSTLTYTNTDDAAGGLSGSVTLDDGTILNFNEIENIICFAGGTNILTPQGERKIETLKKGDPVLTRDHGIQRIKWIGTRTVPAVGRFAPIAIKKNVLGAQRELLVSPQHRMLFTGYQAELLFGASEILVSAKHLVDGQDVTIREGGMVTYIHMMFEQHEIVFAEGAASESFHPGDVGLSAITDPAREELFELFPELRSAPESYGDTARKCLKKHEASLLIA